MCYYPDYLKLLYHYHLFHYYHWYQLVTVLLDPYEFGQLGQKLQLHQPDIPFDSFDLCLFLSLFLHLVLLFLHLFPFLHLKISYSHCSHSELFFGISSS